MDKKEMFAAIDEITGAKVIEWNDFLTTCDLLAIINKNNPEWSPEVVSYFHKIIENPGYNYDIAPRIEEEYLKLQKNLTHEQKLESMLFLLDKKPKFALRIIDKDAEIIPNLSKFILAEIKNKNADQVFLYAPMIARLSVAAEDELCRELLDEVLVIGGDKKIIANNTYDSLGLIYEKKPALRENVFEKITSFETKAFSVMYKNISRVAKVDPSKVDDCLDFLDANIGSSANDASDLNLAYKVLEDVILLKYPHKKDEVNKIFEKALENPKNSRETKKVLWRYFGKTDELSSRAILGQRVEKNNDNPNGWIVVDSVPKDEVCVLFLGGDGTISERAANGYLASVEELLREKELYGKANMYAVAYDFGDYVNKEHSRMKLMQEKKRKVKIKGELTNETLNPRYIKEIFEKAFLPRISQDMGKKRILPEEAAKSLRKLNVVTHCHGAYAMLKIEEMMGEKMQELGYTKQEQELIQKQLLVLSHAPYAPLGVAKSTMISFASAADFEVEHYNNFQAAVSGMKRRKEPIPLSFFPEKLGNLFLTPSIDENDEHNFIGYNLEQDRLSKEGKAVLKMSGNVLANGIKNSLAGGGELPSMESLVGCADVDGQKFFKKLSSNGDKLYQKIVKESTLLRKTAKKQLEA